MDGEIVGSVLVVRIDDTTAKLLLLVEPTARRLGLGSRLVAECSRFARRSGYQKLVLWINSVLDVVFADLLASEEAQQQWVAEVGAVIHGDVAGARQPQQARIA